MTTMWPRSMATVGIRELKNRLSEFLRRVADGERITVTDRGRPVAVLAPPGAGAGAIVTLVREGVARWGGGKPRGSVRPARPRGPSSRSVAEALPGHERAAEALRGRGGLGARAGAGGCGRSGRDLAHRLRRGSRCARTAPACRRPVAG